MTFPEVMFYAEAEGLLPTRAGRINAVIKDIKNSPNPYIDYLEFEKILKGHGLKYDELSTREKNYIDACIR